MIDSNAIIRCPDCGTLLYSKRLASKAQVKKIVAVMLKRHQTSGKCQPNKRGTK